jgi:transposase-like protein
MSTKPFSIRQGQSYPLDFRLSLVRSYLCGDLSYLSLARKHGIDPSTLRGWVRRFGPGSITSSSTPIIMAKKKSPSPDDSALAREVRLLRQSLKDKDRELDSLRIRVNALDLMIDIAERALGISIRKKFGTKP